MAVQGNLKDFSLSSLISVNCNEMNVARLVVKRGDEEASVYFEEGNIVHANLNDVEGEDVLYTILRWKEGEFTLEQDFSAPKKTVNKPWSGIVLEGMKRLDEWEQDLELDIEAGRQQAETIWEERERQLYRELCRVPGIQQVGIVDIEGNVYPPDKADLEKHSLTTAVFVFQRAKTIANLLGEGAIQHVLITGSKERRLILDYEGGICHAALTNKASTAKVMDAMRTLQARRPS